MHKMFIRRPSQVRVIDDSWCLITVILPLRKVHIVKTSSIFGSGSKVGYWFRQWISKLSAINNHPKTFHSFVKYSTVLYEIENKNKILNKPVY